MADATQTADAEQETLLNRTLAATKNTERDYALQMLSTLTEQALEGTVTWNKSLTNSVELAIKKIDEQISKQLAEVMHAPEFQQLEGSWRGLSYLLGNTETSTRLKLKVLNVAKSEIAKDLGSAVEFDQSALFKKVYEDEFGSPGGEPYGVMIADYSFSSHPDDINFLQEISGVASSAFCPFIAAADSSMVGLDDWTDLSKPRDLAKIFDSVEYAQWKSFRDSEDSRFVVLTLPRTLARLPYGSTTKQIEEFDYEEFELAESGKFTKPVDHRSYTWMNTSFVLGTKLTDAFAKHSWCTAVRGAENGGKVEGLPAHIFVTDDGDLDMKCPTEVGITDRREAELSNLGFYPLSHYKNTDYSVFFGAQTTQEPKTYDTPEATANAAISARLPYILATSRFAHYLKVIARDKIGSFMERGDCEIFLNRWISQYVASDANPPALVKSKYPLAAAKIQVDEVPGRPGAYHAIAWLRPWLQLEELTSSLRLVAEIP